jgi:hypothetical protein
MSHIFDMPEHCLLINDMQQKGVTQPCLIEIS